MAFRFSFVSNNEARKIDSGVAVVIDVVRAFTTAAWAFERGIERIVLTDDLAEALQLKSQVPGSLALKDGQVEPGFDLTNSPAQIRDNAGLRGKTIVQRTQHGTIGAVAARRARFVYCASFPNASATAAAMRASGETDVRFVVTGEDGAAEEDRACADFLAALLEHRSIAPASFVARVDASETAQRIQATADAGSPSAHVDDIALCKEVDRFDFAMRASEEDGLLVLRRVKV